MIIFLTFLCLLRSYCLFIYLNDAKYWINFVSYNEEVLWLMLTHKLFIMIDSQKKKKKKIMIKRIFKPHG